MSNMDPFDEFEFKPLTDGLGFHKKAVSLKEGLKAAGVADNEMQGLPLTMPKSMMDETPKAAHKKHTFEDVLSALEKTPLNRSSDLQFTEPLPREPKREAMDFEHTLPMTNPMPLPTPIKSPFPQPEAYKKPVAKKVPTITEQSSVGTRRGAADSPKRKLEPASVSLASAVLDGIIVFALSLVFLIALLMVTKVDISLVINNVSRDRMTKISLAILFISVMQMYVVVARSYFGRTLAEWTFDLQLGQDEEQNQESYPLRIALRSLLTIATGLVLLPLASWLLGRDLAGQLSGVRLYRQRG